MTQSQKIIKYFAIAVAVLIIFSIFSAILGFLNIFTYEKDNDRDREIESIFNSNENVNTLDIDVKAVDLVIKKGNKLLVESNNKYINCQQDENKLVIKEKKHNSWNNKNNKLIITIPEDMIFDAFRLDAGAGKIEIDTINAENAVIDLGAGKVDIDILNISNKLDLEAGTGKVTILDGSINNLDLDMGVGKVTINSKLIGNIDIDAGVGSLELNLLDSLDNYSFVISKGIGSISLNNEKLKEGNYSNGINKINIDGGVGSIHINTNER